MGLQIRFTVLVVGLALGVGTVVGVVIFNFFAMLVNRSHHEQCRQAAALIANDASSAFEEGADGLHKLAEQVVNEEPLLFVAFLNNEGCVLTFDKNRHRQADIPMPQGMTVGTTMGSPRLVTSEQGVAPYLDITYPVLLAGSDFSPGEREGKGEGRSENQTHLVGYVRLGYSLQRTFADVNAATELLTGIAVLVSVLTVPLGFLVVRRMVGPVRDIARTMDSFAQGDLEARCAYHGKDELGELAACYNFMADKLTQKHLETTRLNAELEQRVRDRTAQLRELASRDPLTGLYNRRHFAEVLTRSFAAARRYDSELSCMMIDLDNFKAVNDHLGHQVGDEFLCLTASTITEQLRTADIAARYGGDEFVVLLPHTDLQQAGIFGERILARFAEALAKRYPECEVGISVGIASITDLEPGDEDNLIRAADRALYAAKSDGKNTIVAHTLSA